MIVMSSTDPIQIYKRFEGALTEQMPRLIKEGRVPISTADYMSLYLEMQKPRKVVSISDVNDAMGYIRITFGRICTGDGIVFKFGDKSRIKVVLDSDLIRKINADTYTMAGDLALDSYENLDGEEILIKHLSKMPKTLEEAKACPLLKRLSRGDMVLLGNFIDTVFYNGKKDYMHERNMRICFTGPGHMDSMCPFTFHHVLGLVYGGGSIGLSNPECVVVGKPNFS
jgi:hypothetical protein